MLNFPCHLPYNRLIMETSLFIKHWLFDVCHNFIRYTKRQRNELTWAVTLSNVPLLWHCKWKVTSTFWAFTTICKHLIKCSRFWSAWNELSQETANSMRHETRLNWFEITFFGIKILKAETVFLKQNVAHLLSYLRDLNRCVEFHAPFKWPIKLNQNYWHKQYKGLENSILLQRSWHIHHLVQKYRNLVSAHSQNCYKANALEN